MIKYFSVFFVCHFFSMDAVQIYAILFINPNFLRGVNVIFY